MRSVAAFDFDFDFDSDFDFERPTDSLAGGWFQLAAIREATRESAISGGGFSAFRLSCGSFVCSAARLVSQSASQPVRSAASLVIGGSQIGQLTGRSWS